MIAEKKLFADGLQINLLISGSSEEAIIFVHGNSSNAHIWDRQLVNEQLATQYKMIAFDLPGHGQSGKSGNYSMKKFGYLIRQIAEQLSVKEYILVGLSFGTCIIGEAAPDLPGCKGIVLVSANLTSNEFHPGVWLNPFPEVAAMASTSVPDELLQTFASRMVYDNHFVAGEYVKSYHDTDPAFRQAIGGIIANSEWTDEFRNIEEMNVAVCLVFGEEEKIIHTDYMDGFAPRWRNKTYRIPGAAHFVNAEQPQLFNQLLVEFAGEVFK